MPEAKKTAEMDAELVAFLADSKAMKVSALACTIDNSPLLFLIGLQILPSVYLVDLG